MGGTPCPTAHSKTTRPPWGRRPQTPAFATGQPSGASTPRPTTPSVFCHHAVKGFRGINQGSNTGRSKPIPRKNIKWTRPVFEPLFIPRPLTDRPPAVTDRFAKCPTSQTPPSVGNSSKGFPALCYRVLNPPIRRKFGNVTRIDGAASQWRRADERP